MKTNALQIQKRNFITNGARKSWIISCDYKKLFTLEDDFGQVIKKTIVNFGSNLGFILIELNCSNKKASLKNFLYQSRMEESKRILKYHIVKVINVFIIFDIYRKKF